jgi:hypothetical protein
MMPRAKVDRYTKTETTIGDAVSNAMSEFESLSSELRDWYDNMPENLQGGSKGDMLQEAADRLEGFSEPSVPEELGTIKLNVITDRRARSRSARCDEAVSLLNNVKGVLEEIEEGAKHYDKAQELIQELDEIIDEAEGVEFPGMFG